MITALFPGSFDPFTIGHYSVVNKVLKISQKVIIAIGENEGKNAYLSIEERLKIIHDTFCDDERVEVVTYKGLTTDLAKETGASYIVRGVRSVFDYEYERNMAEVNRQLSGIETVILFTDPEYAHISSSVVRELIKLGRDVSAFLPTKETK